MNLTKFEQSGVIFETQSGFRLAVDIGNKTPLEKLDGITSDATLISHIHGDHFSSDHIKALAPEKLYINQECQNSLTKEIPSCEIVTIKEGDTIDIGEINVKVFAVDHGPNVNPFKENFGFLLSADGKTIYFGGDIFYPSGIDVSVLEVDIALIPVGTFYTFGPQEAMAFAKRFKKIGTTIPMHYEKNPETREEFIVLAKKEGIAV